MPGRVRTYRPLLARTLILALGLVLRAVWDDLNRVRWAVLRHNCGPAADVPGLLRACAGGDRQAAVAAVRKLDNALYCDVGWVCSAASAALPFLVRLAADPAVEVRVMVLDLIARIAAQVPEAAAGQVDPGWPGALEAAAPVLLSLLDDAHPGMRRIAAYLAGAGGLPAGLAVPELRARSSRAEPDWAARWDVVISLGAAAAGSALAGEVRDELSELARDGRDPQVCLAAVHGLAAAGEPVTGHVGVMTGAMADAGWTGWEASEWLGIGSPEMIVRATGRLLLDEPGAAVAFAAGVMDTGDAGQRTEALMHMGALLGRWHAVPGSVPGLLAGQLDAPEPEVRYRAAYLLACTGADTRPWAGQLAGLAGDGAAAGYLAGVTVGDAAVWALARASDPRCLPGLRERLLGDRTGFAAGRVGFPRDATVFDLPGMGLVVTRADPGARLLDPVLSRLRRASRDADTIAGMLCETLGTWGEKAAAAVPELRRLLQLDHPAVYPSPAAAHALGRIGPAAHAAAGELRHHARFGSAEAAWALWRVTGQPKPALSKLTRLATRKQARPRAIELLADFGELAAAAQPRLREFLHDPDDRRKTEAAWALWRATGDASTAVDVLTSVVQPLSTGSYLPVHLAALRHLAAIPETSGQATGIAEAVLANPRRLALSGGWRTFEEDDQIRAAAAAYLTSRTTGQPG